MKKGLLLALTMVALVAMVVPVGAIAPVIEQLPSVIIGDTGDVDGTGAAAKHLYRYTNIMNIATSNKIAWGNVDLGFGDAQKHAYYMSTDTNIKAYNQTKAIDQVTDTDVAAILHNGTKPAAAKEITDGGNFFWLSLANNLSGSSNVYQATAAANGLTDAQFPLDGKAKNFTLVLADGDFPTTAVAQADFSVYTVENSDDGFSGAAVKIYGSDFSAGPDGWVYTGAKNVPGLADAISGTTGGHLTMKVGATSSSTYFGTWSSGVVGQTGAQPIVPVDLATQSGNIFRGTFTLSSTATNASATPGYRIFYEAAGFSHMGGISHNSTDSVVGDSIYAPKLSETKDVVLYWGTPSTLTEYGDSGKLATVQSGKDFRDYIIAFDMIGYDGQADNGVLGLDKAVIEMIARPAAGASLITWGASPNTAFNSGLGASGWVAGTTDDSGQLGKGTATVGSGSITLQATAATTGYQKVGPYASATMLPTWQSGKLIRSNVTLASSNVNASPTIRVLTMAVKTDGSMRSFIWVDQFSGDTAKTLYAPSGNTGAASPVAAGSALEFYAFMHTAPASGGVLDPQVDCYAAGTPAFSQTGAPWAAETATLTLSKFQYEECQLQ